MARFISMKDFRSETAVKMVRGNDKTIVLGMITGHVTATKVKTVIDKDGQANESIVCIGDFQGIAYGKRAEADEKGEVYAPLEAEQIYLPKYYAELIESKIKTHKGPMIFAVEIVMEPSKGAIGYSYDVRSVMARPAESPLAQLHAKMREAGLLRSAPVTQVALPDFTDMKQEPRPGALYLGKSEPTPSPAPTEAEPSTEAEPNVDPETGEVIETVGETSIAEDHASRRNKNKHR